jgi:hypothetical protein
MSKNSGAMKTNLKSIPKNVKISTLSKSGFEIDKLRNSRLTTQQYKIMQFDPFLSKSNLIKIIFQ